MKAHILAAIAMAAVSIAGAVGGAFALFVLFHAPFGMGDSWEVYLVGAAMGAIVAYWVARRLIGGRA